MSGLLDWASQSCCQHPCQEDDDNNCVISEITRHHRFHPVSGRSHISSDTMSKIVMNLEATASDQSRAEPPSHDRGTEACEARAEGLIAPASFLGCQVDLRILTLCPEVKGARVCAVP
jgi:hypothetical protein